MRGGAIMGRQVPFWEAVVGFCRWAPVFKRLQTPMRVETANPLGNQDPGSRQAPWEDPCFQTRRTDILKCEAAKPPATSKGLTGGSDEADRSGKWVSFVKFLDLIASFLFFPSLLPLSPDSSSLSYNFCNSRGLSP